MLMTYSSSMLPLFLPNIRMYQGGQQRDVHIPIGQLIQRRIGFALLEHKLCFNGAQFLHADRTILYADGREPFRPTLDIRIFYDARIPSWRRTPCVVTVI